MEAILAARRKRNEPQRHRGTEKRRREKRGKK
jgi:hypothetical protein